MCRYIAKNIVAAGIADNLMIQLAYVIGKAEPLSIMVDTYGTGRLSDEKIINIITDHFELTPHGIIAELDLRDSDGKRFTQTAAYGHFGRELAGFTWERTDKAKELKKYIK
jgi:S-adenosylmethionine synthetase